MYNFTKAGIFIIAQNIDDPKKVIFYWDPKSPLDNSLFALTRAWTDNFPPNLKRQVTLDNGNIAFEAWSGVYWDDEMDNLIKSMAESFLDLRFASPDRTQLLIQADFWPEDIGVG